MTHETDCSVKPEAIETLNRIAECFYEGTADRLDDAGRSEKAHYDDIDPAEEPCHEMARDVDMSFLGSGVARATFSVVPDPDARPPPESEITEFSECVVKFARYASAGLYDGEVQMREEIDNRDMLPPVLYAERNNSPGPLAPIKDHDTAQQRWLSMPYCPPPGSIDEVEEEMRRLGWRSGDLHAENVGTYPDHGDHALIDYGVEFEQVGNDLHDDVDSLKDGLSALGAHSFKRSVGDKGGASLRFYPDPDLPGDGQPPERTKFSLTRDGLVRRIKANFPTFDPSTFTGEELAAEADMMNYVPKARGATETRGARQTADGYAVYVDLEAQGGAPMPPLDAVDEYEAMENAYDFAFERFVSGYGNQSSSEGVPTASGSGAGVADVTRVEDFTDRERQWQTSLEGIGMRTVAFPGRNEPPIEFRPPEGMVPFQPTRESQLWWFNAANVKRVIYHAADVVIAFDGQADARGAARTVAREVTPSLPSNADVQARLDFIGSNPQTDGDTYTVRYGIFFAGDYLSPKTTIAALQRVTDEHNRTFPRTFGGS